MSAVDRSYWLAVAIASYVGVASLQNAPTRAGLFALALGPLLLLWLWGRTRPRLVSPSVERSALMASRVAASAALCWVHARLGPPGVPGLDVAASLAAGTCAVAGAFTLARIAPVRGLMAPPEASRSVDAAGFSGMLWGAAAVISVTRFVVPERAPVLDPLTLDYATTAASIGSLLVLIAAAWRVRVLRELELGVADRAEAAVAITVTALSVAVPVAAINIAPPDRVLPAALICASVGCIWTVLAPDPATVSATLRGTLAVMLLGVPAALLAAVFIQQSGERGGVVALVGCALCITAGLIARNVARPLGPEQSRWLLSISEANQNALDPEPNTAIAAALRALKKTSKSPSAVPQLWRLDPPAVVSVDVAGYLHEDEADIPSHLLELGLEEPERTLRAETLAALQVRRPEVRPLLAWFEVRGAFCATVVMDDEGPTGFLLLPKGERTARLTLEEARAARTLADRLSSLFSITSALARSRKRELSARKQAERWHEEYDKVRGVLQGQGRRHREFARTLAHPLVSTSYSAAARLGISELERLAQRAKALLLVTPIGVQAECWAAVAHLASPNADGPLLVIDAGAQAREPADVWTDPERSPLVIARGGSLFIRDLHLLPKEVQQQLLLFVTEPEATEDSLARPLLLSSAPLTAALLIESGDLEKAFATVFAKNEMNLPALADRAEDLRSLVLDALTRSDTGRGPRGIERHALQALLDHPWSGNERELHDVVARASALETGQRLTVAALHNAGMLQVEAPPPPSDPHSDWVRPSSSPPRRRPRAPRRRGRRG